MSQSTVTVAIPVHKRLHLLPRALQSVASQQYSRIDLLVSDNGNNGPTLRHLIEAHYPRPFRLRHTAFTVPIVDHFNQLLAAAEGEYFVLLCDDDTISPEFVSDLAGRLDANPRAAVALGQPESIDAEGRVRTYPGEWPETLAGPEFLSAWATRRVRLVSTVTLMARTAIARQTGGYLDLPRALYSDNVLLLRLALAGEVVLGQRARFRWTIDDGSAGFSASQTEVAAAARGFMRYLDQDPQLRALGAADPRLAAEVREALRLHCATWYFFRWKERYSQRLGTLRWIRAAFAMPFIPAYYRMVWEELRTLVP